MARQNAAGSGEAGHGANGRSSRRASDRSRPAPLSEGAGRPPTLSIDVMSGDDGAAAAVAGAALAARSGHPARFLLHGDGALLAGLVERSPELGDRAEIAHCDGVVEMDVPPSQALRRGRDSSMWRALDAVAEGKADVALSAGNTGALMTMAMVRLRPAEGVKRPAIAALWPALSPSGFNVVLDVGADVRAEPETLLGYAVMGAEYARIALDVERPKVALLNVGTEDIKGRTELREAAERLRALAETPNLAFDFTGFIEADRIADGGADVIVADGFSGNVALKSAEGAARLVGLFMKQCFGANWLTRAGALAAYPALKRLKAQMDPRRVNGGVFLGLNGVVVKSHGGADATGFAAAIDLAARMSRRGVVDAIAAKTALMASALAEAPDLEDDRPETPLGGVSDIATGPA